MLPDHTATERTPYCVAQGCAGLPPREHLEAHTRDGSTGPDQVAELIDAFERHVRAQDATEPIIARWKKGLEHHPAGTTVECVDADDNLRGISLELSVDDREALGLMLVDPEGEMDQADDGDGETMRTAWNEVREALIHRADVRTVLDLMDRHDRAASRALTAAAWHASPAKEQFPLAMRLFGGTTVHSARLIPDSGTGLYATACGETGKPGSGAGVVDCAACIAQTASKES
jgi:hypothetical protein